jgi:flagellar hook assembly protein FlgD
LIKAQDEAGNSIEDWGIYGGWKNNIYDFIPGKGYNIKLSADDTLWINENYPKSSTILTEIAATKHFKTEFGGNGVDHMNINLVGLPINVLHSGDELAIFDGATCVGAVTIMPNHLLRQTASIAASARDNQGMPGFSEGNLITLKLWNSKQNTEFILEPEIVKGTSTFAKHETSIASLEKYTTTGLDGIFASEQSKINCYPNPFSNEVTVEINLMKDSEVKVEVLNQLGQLVKYINTGEHLNRGIHRLIWDGTNSGKDQAATGIYLIRMKLNEMVYYRKVVYSK